MKASQPPMTGSLVATRPPPFAAGLPACGDQAKLSRPLNPLTTLTCWQPARLPLQLVFLDVEIKQRRAGRIEMVLFPDISPRAAENFR